MGYNYQRLNETNLSKLFEFLGLCSSGSINDSHLYYTHFLDTIEDKNYFDRPLYELLSTFSLSSEEVVMINESLTFNINNKIPLFKTLFSNQLLSTKDKVNIINAALLNNTNKYYNTYFNLDILDLDNWDDVILYRKILNSLLFFSYIKEVQHLSTKFIPFTDYISINQFRESSVDTDRLIEDSKENYFNYIKSLLLKVMQDMVESYNTEVDKLILAISHELHIYLLSTLRSYSVNLCVNFLYNFIMDITDELGDSTKIDDYIADFLLEDLYNSDTFVNIDLLDSILKKEFSSTFTPKQVYYLFKEYFVDRYNIKDKLILLQVTYSL